MKKIILSIISFLVSFNLFASPSDLFRPSGTDILDNCSQFLDIKNEDQLERSTMYLLCQTAINNTYQTIRGPMIVMRGANMVCYQDYYHLAELSYLHILSITVAYIKTHPSLVEANLSTIMTVMMNEYYPIPTACKK